jgi:hypothetical protein
MGCLEIILHKILQRRVRFKALLKDNGYEIVERTLRTILRTTEQAP